MVNSKSLNKQLLFCEQKLFLFKNKSFVYIVFFFSFITGCIVPVNLTYESAKLVKKGNVDLQFNESNYFSEEDGLTNINLGVKASIGVTDNYNIKTRYEFIGDINGALMNYLEIEHKINVITNKIAIGMPVNFYFTDKSLFGWGWDPRIYITPIIVRNKFDWTLIPKTHLIFNGDDIDFLPAISIGMGFSSNLDKWAIRPEIGYDGFLSFGVGFNLILDKKQSITNN